MKFAQYFAERRKALGLSMRRFAEDKGYDVGYISRLENDVIKPPAELEKLKALAVALELTPETSEWVMFFDLAAARRKELPEDIKNQPQMINLLPAFYRTLRKEKITRDEVEHLLKLLKGGANGTEKDSPDDSVSRGKST